MLVWPPESEAGYQVSAVARHRVMGAAKMRAKTLHRIILYYTYHDIYKLQNHIYNSQCTNIIVGPLFFSYLDHPFGHDEPIGSPDEEVIEELDRLTRGKRSW